MLPPIDLKLEPHQLFALRSFTEQALAPATEDNLDRITKQEAVALMQSMAEVMIDLYRQKMIYEMAFKKLTQHWIDRDYKEGTLMSGAPTPSQEQIEVTNKRTERTDNPFYPG